MKLFLKTRPTFLLLSLVGVLLYVPFPAVQYDPNGIVEAESMESGILLPHNHMAYRPIGFVLFNSVQFLGYSGNSVPVFQLFNAVCGALSLGFCYLSFEAVLRNRRTAIIASLWLGTTFIYWCVSTDVTYMALATLFASAALAASTRGSSPMHAVWAGVLAALCVLTWQAGIFLVPGLLAVWFLKTDRRPAAYLLAASGSVTLVIYIVAGLLYFHVRSITDFFQWALRYGTVGTLPMWGQWSFDRLPVALHSMLASLVPTPLMVWPSELLQHRVQLGRIAIDIAVAAVAILIAGALARVVFVMKGTQRQAAGAFLLGYLAFIPFIVWWDPGQPMWLLLANIFLAGFLGVAWDSPSATSKAAMLFAGCTAWMALTNFVTIIRPRHAQLGPDRTIAQCVGDHTSERDLILAAEWGWPDYLPYLHQRQVLNLINSSLPFTNKDDHLAMIRTRIEETQRQGAAVIMPEPGSYTAEHLTWLESQSRITGADLQRFSLKPGFSCGAREMRIVAGFAP